MDIFRKELEAIRTGIINRYDKERKLRKLQNANDINFVKTPDHYAALAELVELIVKPYVPKQVVEAFPIGYPGTKFFVKVFTSKEESINFHPSTLNACYLFAFGVTRDEYLRKQSFLMEKKYSVQVSKRADIDAVYKINTIVYEGYDVIPYETLLEWHDKNPASIHVITDQFGKVVGNVDILPLKQVALDSFLKGDMVEREIRGEHLFADHERSQVDYLYVESVVNVAGIAAVIEFLRNTPLIVSRLTQSAKSIKKVYCLAASSEGKYFMQNLGFKQYLYEGPPRRDGHEKDIHQADLKDILKEVASLFRDNPHYKADYDSIMGIISTLDQ